MRTLGLVLGAIALSLTACGNSAEGNDQNSDINSGGAGAIGSGGSNQAGGAGGSGNVSGSGSGGSGVGGSGVGGSGVGGSGTGGSGTGGSGSGGDAGVGGDAGAGGTGPVDPPGTVTITTDDFDLQPGMEVYKCQNFDNPFNGQDVAVQRIVSDMAKGSHHLHLYNLTEGTSRRLEDCEISDFHALVHAAGQPHLETQYPAGMATKIRGTTGLRIQLHYLNTTQQAIKVRAAIKLSPVDMSTVTKWVAQLYLNRLRLTIPPGPNQTLTTTCSIPDVYGPISLISAGSHMHMRGTHFVANTGSVIGSGTKLIETDEWDEPPGVAYDPPIPLNPRDTVTWRCTYNNDTAGNLIFGQSASKNEMCIYLARYYTANPEATQLECQAVSDTVTPARPNPN